LSPAAVAIFKERGIEADVKRACPRRMIKISTAMMPRHPFWRPRSRGVIPRREEYEGDRRAGIGRRQCRHAAATAAGIFVHEHAIRQFHHHANMPSP